MLNLDEFGNVVRRVVSAVNVGLSIVVKDCGRIRTDVVLVAKLSVNGTVHSRKFYLISILIGVTAAYNHYFKISPKRIIAHLSI